MPHRNNLVARLVATAALSFALLLTACGGAATAGTSSSQPYNPVASPTIATTAAQNGAEIVSLSTTPKTNTIYYTLDGTIPTTSSQQYLAPFLVASNLTVSAVAVVPVTFATSNISSQTFTLNIPSGTLVWSDEFNNTTGANAAANPLNWTYATGPDLNYALDTTCAFGSNTSPCVASSPNAFVGTDGYLHIVAQEPSTGVYTGGRLLSQGLFSFQYGRLEARIQVPEAQGFWPGFWANGNTHATAGWPACGEIDILERWNAALNPDWNQGSIHGTGFTGSPIGTKFYFPSGENAAGWHTYGIIFKPGSMSYYVDNPATPYATYTPASLAPYPGAVWPFDNGQSFWIEISNEIGGSTSGPPNSSTPFPSTMLVDYVRFYTN